MRYQRTLRYVAANWPFYVRSIVLGAFVALLALVFSWQRDLWGLIPIALAILLLQVYFLTASIWGLYLRYDERKSRPQGWFVAMAGMRADHHLVYVGLGEQYLPRQIAARLISGRMEVIDIYVPQLVSSAVVARLRASLPPQPESDMRIRWRNGRVDLLPVRDDTQDIVILAEVLGRIDPAGDRDRLLTEAYRILKPGGRLVIMEQTRTRMTTIVKGFGSMAFSSDKRWEQTLKAAGFVDIVVRSPHGLHTFFRGEKPAVYRNMPLPLQI